MPLQIQYSKQIARELGKIAVYFPGDEISIGDIIKFPYGKKGLFKKDVPWGTFERVTSLKNLGVVFEKTGPDKNPDSYQFTTKDSVEFSVNGSANADLGNEKMPSADANLGLKLKSEGAIYFLALECRKNSIDNILSIENQIQSKSELLWDGTFLVTGVTIAKKALVIQSQSKESEFILGGDIKGLKNNQVDISANANLALTKKRGSSFVKDWSDNVTVFMEVMKMEKQILGERIKDFAASRGIPPVEVDEEENVMLKKVNIEDYLNY